MRWLKPCQITNNFNIMTALKCLSENKVIDTLQNTKRRYVCMKIYLIKNEYPIWSLLKSGNCTPNQNFSMLCLLSQNYQHCFEKYYKHPEAYRLIWETQKWCSNLSRGGVELSIKTIFCWFINNLRTAWPVMPFWVPKTTYFYQDHCFPFKTPLIILRWHWHIQLAKFRFGGNSPLIYIHCYVIPYALWTARIQVGFFFLWTPFSLSQFILEVSNIPYNFGVSFPFFICFFFVCFSFFIYRSTTRAHFSHVCG